MPGQPAESLGAGAPAVGDVIAQKYRIEGLLGRGGMGVVVSARHLQLGQSVAIKLLTLPHEEERGPEAVARFLNEAQAAARLRSDHVVRIYDVGQLESGLPFMVMELLNGADLGTILEERGPLPEAEAIDYVLQACAGVAEAHQLGIVHRDLKPSNLFVTRRSDGLPLLKVLDFGISKQLSDPGSGAVLPTFTNTRTLMGSPNYMSPEQVRDARRVDARTDVWAMGIILQELITNAPVFGGESFPGVCAAIVADPPIAVRTLLEHVNPRLEAIIERCLQKDMQRRYQSIAELVSDLAPLGGRFSASGVQVVYSSQPTVTAAPAIRRGTPSATPLVHAPTVALPPTGNGPATGAGGTLESARLQPTPNTQSAVSSPNSRIEVAEPPAAPAPRRRGSWLAFGSLGLTLAAGLVWLVGRREVALPNKSLDAPPSTASTPEQAPSLFTLSIDSEPPGAVVSEGSIRLGITPFSLSVELPEGASPRVFVLEKDGYQPYVVRQGAARGQVRVMAALSAKPGAASVTTAAAPVLPLNTAKPHAPAPKRPAAPTAKPASDIRLER